MLSSLPMVPGPQVVPSAVCCQCEVCCRFPESGSSLRPYFTDGEILLAILHGISAGSFPDLSGCQISVIPHPTDEGFICPAFDPVTHHCQIYDVRPLDCQLYPFALMWNEEGKTVLFGWDPKCPYLLAASGGGTSTTRPNEHPATLNLPPSILDRAESVAEFIESNEMLKSLSSHPLLITPFQPDVVVLKRLDRLTAALSPAQ